MIKMSKAMQLAREHNFALPAFNFESFEVLKGLALGAQKCNAPIIVQTTAPALNEMGIENIVSMVDYYNNKYNLIVFLNLDHATDLELIKECIKKGYSSVMIDCSDKSLKENISLTREVADYAHKYGASVEAEIGIVGTAEIASTKTDINTAVQFAKEAHVDSLAVSVGSLHGGRSKNKRIDMKLLQEICKKISIPLVLHGSSGVVEDDLTKTTANGISKINIETELRVLYRTELEKFLAEHPKEIKIRYISQYMQEKIAEFVCQKCEDFGATGKVDLCRR